MRSAIQATRGKTGGARRHKRRWLRALLIKGTALVNAAIERARQRRALLGLDGHMLKDIGITRSEAEREYTTPFWR